MRLIFLFSMLCLSLLSCTLFRKDSDELELITKDILKAKQGIDINIEPVNKDKIA